MAEFNGFTPREAPELPDDPNSGDFRISGLGSFGSLQVSGISTLNYLNVSTSATISNAYIGIATVYDLYVDNGLHLSKFLYDRTNSAGSVGQVLVSDASGVRWSNVSSSAAPLQSIDILDEGVGIGQVSRIDFYDGSDPNNLVNAQLAIGSTDIANVYISDRWSLSGSDIYRNSKVGINTVSPTYDLDVDGTANITSNLIVSGNITLNNTTESSDKDTGSFVTQGGVGIEKNLNIGGEATIGLGLTVSGNTNLDSNLVVGGGTSLSSLSVSGVSTFIGKIELDSSLVDINNSDATGKFDYRLASVGAGVSWRPPGVQTQNAIWVTMDGNDSNSGYLEGDAKRTVGAAASIAQPGDTIFIRSGVYYENNPIGLRTDVSISGQDLRLVTIIPNNPTKDVFHVRRGCLIENLNFAGSSVSVAHTGCGAVAFPPTQSDVNVGIAFSSISGYTDFGPATEGSSGRWRSPYVRNCTNFMSGSIGMKINGDHATASTLGADLKSMVCDSFTQYNENGIGVSITNNGYAQLVSIFTINCDIGIYADTGGSCDLTNSNSSFGNYGLYAVGLGRTEFTGTVLSDTIPETDIVTFTSLFDDSGNPRRPYDGQALWFKINLDNYPDAQGSGVITSPMVELGSIAVTNGGSGYSSASPPSVLIVDLNDLTQSPKGPQGIIAEASPTIDDASGSITSIDVVSSGRNYLSTQNIGVIIEGSGGATATANMTPIYYTIFESTETTSPSGITTVTFNEFIPYGLFSGDEVELRRISRILTSSHSFEYIGTGTNINTSTPLQGAIPIKANEVVALDGAQIPFTSTDQKGNFDIGSGIQINQTTSTISGRDFSRAIQAEVTPLILALR